MPEEELAIMMSGRVLESISARSFSFSSGFSGAFCLAVSFAVLEMSCFINVGDGCTPLG